jgi:hypothetical protein
MSCVSMRREARQERVKESGVLGCEPAMRCRSQNLGRGRRRHIDGLTARRCLGLGPHHCMYNTPPPHLVLFAYFTYDSIHGTIMAAIYKPSEAIALLRPSFVLPRIQPSSTRRATLGRKAFSASQNVQATHGSTPNPSPAPQRKSITLTGDTGQVRWSDLSPVEKAVRTTQQSFNLVVVAFGILATVRLTDFTHISILTHYIGRRDLLPLLRRLLSLLQNRPIQSRRNHDPRRLTLSSPPRTLESNIRIRRILMVALGPQPLH